MSNISENFDLGAPLNLTRSTLQKHDPHTLSAKFNSLQSRSYSNDNKTNLNTLTSQHRRSNYGVLGMMFKGNFNKSEKKQDLKVKYDSGLIKYSHSYKYLKDKAPPEQVTKDLETALKRGIMVQKKISTKVTGLLSLPPIKKNFRVKSKGNVLSYIDTNIKSSQKFLDKYASKLENITCEIGKGNMEEIKISVYKSLRRRCPSDIYTHEDPSRKSYDPCKSSEVSVLNSQLRELLEVKRKVIKKKEVIFLKEFPLIEKEIDSIISSQVII